MATHSSILPGKSHGQRSLEGYSPQGQGCKGLDAAEHLNISINNYYLIFFYFIASAWKIPPCGPKIRTKLCSLSYSCLENPRDGGAWWAAICVVAQSRTQLKQLSSSRSSSLSYSTFWGVWSLLLEKERPGPGLISALPVFLIPLTLSQIFRLACLHISSTEAISFIPSFPFGLSALCPCIPAVSGL